MIWICKPFDEMNHGAPKVRSFDFRVGLDERKRFGRGEELMEGVALR
jgi:hypothetical protein